MVDPALHVHYIEFDDFLQKSKKNFDIRWETDFRENGSLGDFHIIRTLSSGSFGRVLLVKHKEKGGKVIALKMMDKAHIVKTKQVEHTHAEIRIMDAMKFPFLVGMEYFFKDNCYLFLGMPFINGGELFIHLRREKKFSETQTKFFSAQVILAFDYLHYLGLVYRDLKPENILVDDTGYLKVTDYGFCKKIDNSRTWTLCGTPEYLAPEVILSNGYNKSVDWWAIGILMYEMAAGFTPFYSKDPMKMYEKIVSGKFQYPSHFSVIFKSLLANLIIVDRSKRYGSLINGSRDVKEHEFFKTLNWDDIFRRKIHPKFKPTVAGPGDHSNFEAMEELPMKVSPTEEYADLFSVIAVKPLSS